MVRLYCCKVMKLNAIPLFGWIGWRTKFNSTAKVYYNIFLQCILPPSLDTDKLIHIHTAHALAGDIKTKKI